LNLHTTPYLLSIYQSNSSTTDFTISLEESFVSDTEIVPRRKFQGILIPIDLNEEEIRLPPNYHLIYLGFLEPTKLNPSILQKCNYKFLTYGLLNIALIVFETEKAEWVWSKLKKDSLLNAKKLDISRNQIISSSHITHKNIQPTKLKLKNQHDNFLLTSELKNSIENFLSESIRFNDSSVARIEKIIESYSKIDIENYPEMYLVAVNSSIRNLHLQLFSSTDPSENYDYFHGLHSLFGLGMIICGLNNLRSFIDQRIIKAEYAFRVEKMLEDVQVLPKLERFGASDVIWKTDYLFEATNDKKEELQTLSFAHVLSRVGFQNLLNIVSVPEECIYQGNTFFYTPHTITHELSHSVIKTILSLIYPSTEKEFKALFNAYRKNDVEVKLKVALASAILNTMIEYNDIQQRLDLMEEVKLKDIDNIIQVYNSEIEELLVHLFDFSYFYNQDSEYYIKNVWLSWSMIPNVADRIEEYTIRTLSTVISKNLAREARAFEITCDEVLSNLKSISSICKNGVINKAIDFINRNRENESFTTSVLLNKGIAQIFMGLFYSEKIASTISQDIWLDNTSDYSHIKRLELMNVPFENPLFFLKKFAKDKKASIADSYWLFYNLCFNYEVDDK